MEKEFVPYEQALALKKLGFDEPCVAFYYGQLNRIEIGFNWLNEGCKNSLLEEITSAPLYQQAFRWFREKYLLFGYPFPNDYQKYGYRIVEMSSDGNNELFYDWGTKDTVEEAELECLKKLIEIVKNGK